MLAMLVRWASHESTPPTMKVLLSLIIPVILCLIVTPSAAQMPGHWEKTVLCTKCNAPAGIDFSGSENGVIVLETQRLGGTPPPQKTSVYSTIDGGASWLLNLDTVSHPILYDDKVVLRDGHLMINCFIQATMHSADLGRSIIVMGREFVYDLDFMASSPSTLFRITKPTDRSIDYVVSRDSGRSFSSIHKLEFADYNIMSAKLVDTNEMWVIIHGAFDGPVVKRRRLLHTMNKGESWRDVYPFDTSGVDGNLTAFGNARKTLESMVLGSNPGSLYLLSNFYKIGTPEQRLFDLLFTTNNGDSWVGDSSHVIEADPIFDVDLLRNPDGSQLWLLLSNAQTLAYSPDNAKTWVHDSETFKDNPIHYMLWKDSVTGFAVTHTSDSTLAFWKYIPNPSGVEHLDDHPKTYFKLASTVLKGEKLRALATQPLSGQFAVYDILGRMVWTGSVKAARSETLELDVPSLPGVYFLSYSQGSQRQSVRYVRD
jgi:hypothetical protein